VFYETCHQSYLLYFLRGWILTTHLAFLIWKHGAGLWMLDAVVCTQG